MCISSPTCQWGVRDRGVIEEPYSLDSVHPPAFNAHCHPALLTYSHAWREDDSWHTERLLFLWGRGDEANKRVSERKARLRWQLLCNNSWLSLPESHCLKLCVCLQFSEFNMVVWGNMKTKCQSRVDNKGGRHCLGFTLLILLWWWQTQVKPEAWKWQ